jgi:hypothetical protein
VRKAEHDLSGGKEVKTNADTFHQWLVLSRLIAISEGKLELSKEGFEKGRSIEAERLLRLVGATTSKATS